MLRRKVVFPLPGTPATRMPPDRSARACTTGTGSSQVIQRATRRLSEVTQAKPAGPRTPATPTRLPPGMVK